jgi:hypothetical protein
MQEARKPLNLAATSRVTITVIGEKLLDPFDHLRDELFLAEDSSGQPPDGWFQVGIQIAVFGAQITDRRERDRQCDRIAIEIGDIEAEGNSRIFMDEETDDATGLSVQTLRKYTSCGMTELIRGVDFYIHRFAHFRRRLYFTPRGLARLRLRAYRVTREPRKADPPQFGFMVPPRYNTALRPASLSDGPANFAPG